MQRKSFTVEEARKKLEYYCSYQERCHKEIDKKLNEMNMIASAREVIIIHLIENGFLNEERYAKAFVGGKFRIKKWGKQRLTRELKMKGISDYNIRSALKDIDDLQYEDVFNLLAKKKFAELSDTNKYKKRKKLADYLLYRGWESDLVYKKVTELIP
ncbi:MAG: regulatory protein RecX [Flavobacteriaceae bacterium]|nr:regulatory protein RecX [Flavobacteriaceae bacterium]